MEFVNLIILNVTARVEINRLQKLCLKNETCYTVFVTRWSYIFDYSKYTYLKLKSPNICSYNLSTYQVATYICILIHRCLLTTCIYVIGNPRYSCAPAFQCTYSRGLYRALEGSFHSCRIDRWIFIVTEFAVSY